MKRLTKSQYEAIANVLNIGTYLNAKGIAQQLAREFAKHDTEFDRPKFLAQCGIKD